MIDMVQISGRYLLFALCSVPLLSSSSQLPRYSRISCTCTVTQVPVVKHHPSTCDLLKAYKELQPTFALIMMKHMVHFVHLSFHPSCFYESKWFGLWSEGTPALHRASSLMINSEWQHLRISMTFLKQGQLSLARKSTLISPNEWPVPRWATGCGEIKTKWVR